MTRAIIVDIANYQPNFSFEKFKQLGGTAVIVKATMAEGYDSKFRRHVAEAKKYGVTLGLYHWVDPTGAVERQADLFSEAIEYAKPDFIAGDNEQWWASWPEYWRYIAGEIPASQLVKIHPSTISAFSKSWFAEIKTRYPNLQLLQYTGAWFINAYAAPISNWINDYPLWLADYKFPASLNMTMPGVAAFASGLNAPQLPLGASGDNWVLWQFNSSIIVDGINQENGINRRVDWNCARGSEEWFYSFLQGTLPPPPAPTPLLDVIITTQTLNIRKGPGINYALAGALERGQTVQAYEVKGREVWVKIAPDKWVAMRFNNSDLAVPVVTP